jgi:transcriptional regulator with XRE-family HTH domain
MNSSPESLARLADRASDRPFFLGSALRRFREARGWTQEELAGYLGCTEADLTMLSLCRMPGVNERHTLDNDIAYLSERFQVDPERLRSVL